MKTCNDFPMPIDAVRAWKSPVSATLTVNLNVSVPTGGKVYSCLYTNTL